MQDKQTDTHRSPVTQSWTARELTLINELADDSVSGADIDRMFPNRTRGAVRVQLYHARERRGIVRRANIAPIKETEPAMLDPNDPGIYAPTWAETQRPKLERANAAFLAALAA